MRIKRPDKKNALSILYAAKQEMNFTLSLTPSTESANTIVRNIYECFRMLGDALLIDKGVVSEDHIAPLKELLTIHIHTTRPIRLVDNLRRLRHTINYYGYQAKKEEAEDAIVLAKELFVPLHKEISKKVKS